MLSVHGALVQDYNIARSGNQQITCARLFVCIVTEGRIRELEAELRTREEQEQERLARMSEEIRKLSGSLKRYTEDSIRPLRPAWSVPLIYFIFY